VVRHFWNDLLHGHERVPGIASSYLCDLKQGDEVLMMGPTGRHFLLPDDFKERDFIFAATGTGIAPYRGMLKEMFDQGYSGQVALYFGAQHQDLVLYDDEFQTYRQHSNFHYVTALSREEQNPVADQVPTRQNRMYVQVKMFLDRDMMKVALAKPDSIIYICGLKGMEAGIFPVIDAIGKELGVEASFAQKLRTDKRLKLEVY